MSDKVLGLFVNFRNAKAGHSTICTNISEQKPKSAHQVSHEFHECLKWRKHDLMSYVATSVSVPKFASEVQQKLRQVGIRTAWKWTIKLLDMCFYYICKSMKKRYVRLPKNRRAESCSMQHKTHTNIQGGDLYLKQNYPQPPALFYPAYERTRPNEWQKGENGN